jgi:hypothetical protein
MELVNEEHFSWIQGKKIRRQVQLRYGKTAAKTFNNLSNKKLFNKNNHFFIKKIFYCRLYLSYCRLLHHSQNKPSKENFDKLKSFVKSFPSVKYLSQMVKELNFNLTTNKKEIIFIKFVIEILLHFLKTFDYPCYKIYRRFVESVCIPFYKKISSEVLKEALDKLKMPVNIMTKSTHF